MWVVNMRMISNKPMDELDTLSRAGFAKFKALPGLLQKHYILNHATGEVGGVYLFETQEAAETYVAGPIVASVKERFGIDGDVTIEVAEILYSLND